ncbi:L-lysine exporter family protein LysE/ArgO [Alicyclobacillus macrosporangiidus]|uniref:L-lysine exporter family protein LysE/ArgO n=2 Tax=Alicyclobacillus macrosporangiidus TaxID=392015 RepID=A0A1I7J2X9_9BACL|nr:L-lysine exporter family protein LysE/ArgO [Alicyclobacillus macrosporangiidus]
MWGLFVSGFLLSLSLCLDIGLVNVAIIKTGLERGAWPSFLVGLGSSFGDLTYAVVSMLGMSVLLRFAAVRWALWFGGSAALLYLAGHMVKESLRPRAIAATADGAAGGTDGRGGGMKSLWMGLGLALASPSAILWFAAVGGSVIAATGQHVPVRGLAAFYAGFFCAGVLWSALVALVAGRARQWLGPRTMRGVSLLSALLLVYFAIRVFLQGLHTWVG